MLLGRVPKEDEGTLYIRFSVKFQGLFAKTDCDVPIINAIILFFHF